MKRRSNTIYMKENASLLFGQFVHCSDLYYNPFILGTHHKALKFLMESNNFIEKLIRWALIYPTWIWLSYNS